MDGRSGVGGAPAKPRPYLSSRAQLGKSPRLVHRFAYGAHRGISGSNNRTRLFSLFGFRTGMPRAVVDRTRQGTRRPCTAYAGVGAIAFYRMLCRFAASVEVARRG